MLGRDHEVFLLERLSELLNFIFGFGVLFFVKLNTRLVLVDDADRVQLELLTLSVGVTRHFLAFVKDIIRHVAAAEVLRLRLR